MKNFISRFCAKLVKQNLCRIFAQNTRNKFCDYFAQYICANFPVGILRKFFEIYFRGFFINILCRFCAIYFPLILRNIFVENFAQYICEDFAQYNLRKIFANILQKIHTTILRIFCAIYLREFPGINFAIYICADFPY